MSIDSLAPFDVISRHEVEMRHNFRGFCTEALFSSYGRRVTYGSDISTTFGKVKMQNRENENLRKIWVGNVEIKSSEQKLRQYFSRWGNVEKVIKPPNHNYAFVIFSTKESVEECIGAKPHKVGGRLVEVELARQGWVDGKGITGLTQSGEEARATAEFERLKLRLEEREREVKLEVDKLGGMKQERDQKVEEVNDLKKVIAGLKRKEEAVKEKREMEQKIFVFKKTLESETSPDQMSVQCESKLGKTEQEKLAMKQKKMSEIMLKK